MTIEPFDAETVVRICESLKDEPGFQQWRTRTRTRERLRFREERVQIEGIAQQLEDLSPAANEHGDRYNNRLDAAPINIRVFARDAEHVGQAENVENFFYALYHDLTRRSTSHFYGTDRRSIDQQTFYGLGILHLDFADNVKRKLFKKQPQNTAELLKLLPEVRFIKNPFVLECPDLSATFWEPDFSVVCEVGEVTISHVLTAYEDLEFSQTDGWEWVTSETMAEDDFSATTSNSNVSRSSYQESWDETAKRYHLETERYIYDIIKADLEDQAGKPFVLSLRPNSAGRPWYAFAAGRLTSSRNPEKTFEPLIEGVYPTVQQLNIMQTLVQSGALLTGRNAFQEVKVGTRQQDIVAILETPAEQRPKIVFDPSQAIIDNPRDGYEWKAMPVPDQSQLILALQNKKQDLDEYGFPKTLDPNRPVEAKSGYDRAQQREGAATHLTPPLRNRAHQWRELFMLSADIIGDLKRPVEMPMLERAQGGDSRVMELTKIKASDFDEFDFTVEFSSVSSSEQFALDEANARKLEQGLISKQRVMEEMYPDAAAEQERVDLEVVAEAAKEKAHADAMALIAEFAPNIAQEEAAAANLALPVPPAGGPEEPGGVRNARPPGGALPGLGAPVVPPEQTQPGQIAPQQVGVGPTGVAQ